ncbi:MAG: ABC transporter substrate-binding protein [Chloroflexi bacterium]|nr:ABC transporter substrate-binding protein [Chloroflexota bacterium]
MKRLIILLPLVALVVALFGVIGCAGETVVETVVVEKVVPGEKVVETVVVEKVVPGEKVVETVIVEKEIVVKEEVPVEVVVTATAAPTAKPAGVVKIGTLLDYTGDLAVYGPAMRNGVDLAVELVNDAGGVLGGKLRAVHKDSGTSSVTAIDSGRALVTIEGVGGIIGSLSSGVTMAVAESVTVPNKVVLISPASTSPAVSVIVDDDYLFRTTVSDAAQGVILARLARELGYATASTIYVNNAYGEGLSEQFKTSFEAAGGTVLATVPQESGQPSYVSELGKATADSPDVVVAISYPASAGVYLREATEGGYASTFLFVDGTKSQDMFDTLGASTFEGQYGTAPGAADSDAKSVFTGLYEERYGQLPTNPFIAESFDAAALLALAIQRAGAADGTSIRDALREVAGAPGVKIGPGDLAQGLELAADGKDIDYVGVAGDQEIDAKGDVLNTIEIWKIQDGTITSTGRFETP